MKQINAAQGDEAKLALLENQKALVDGTAIGQLVSDRQALMALLALVNNRQELTRLQAGQANAAGAVDGSYGFLAEGSGFKKAQFSLAKSEAEYGAFEKFMRPHRRLDAVGCAMDARPSRTGANRHAGRIR